MGPWLVNTAQLPTIVNETGLYSNPSLFLSQDNRPGLLHPPGYRLLGKPRIAQLNTCSVLSLSIELKGQNKPEEYIFHYSILSALNDKVYTGKLTIKELKKHGDLALGTYNFLEGEMVGVDNVIYKVLPEGNIIEADDNELSPYAMITKFDVDISFHLNNISSYDELREKLSAYLQSENIFYAFRIKGRFKNIKCGTVSKQTRPFKKRLKEVLDDRHISWPLVS